MNILLRVQKKIKSEILPRVPKRISGLMKFGINTLSLTKYESLNGNARIYGGGQSQKADLMKIFRLTKNLSIRNVFNTFVANLGRLNSDLKITNKSLINVDITEFLPFAVLVLSLQTNDGRAVPIFINILTYPIKTKLSQNIFITDTLRKFLLVLNHGQSDRVIIPKIVLDRGFMGEYLVSEFSRLGFTFYLRVKKTIWDSHVGDDRFREKMISYHNLGLRIVRSGSKEQRRSRAKQPWYILTNDTTSSISFITHCYYHRFECEEWFKDLKHIFSSKQTFIKKSQTLLTIIWFQILGTWLIFTCKSPHLPPLFWVNSHHRLSWVKQAWEEIRTLTSKPIIRIDWNSS